MGVPHLHSVILKVDAEGFIIVGDKGNQEILRKILGVHNATIWQGFLIHLASSSSRHTEVTKKELE